MSKGVKITLEIIVRVLLLPLIFYASFYLAPLFVDFVKANYQEPFGFFGFLYGFETAFIAMTLPVVLLAGMMYGSLGKKIDYVIVGILLLSTLYFYSIETNVQLQLYLALIGVAVVGIAIGYALKLARMRWLPF